MDRHKRYCKFMLVALLTVGACDVDAQRPCAPAVKASAPGGAQLVPASGLGCVQDWASIKPAAFKEPIENPHRLSWQEWTLLTSVPAFIIAVATVFFRCFRRGTGRL
jgi:hypothetical protein